MFVYLLIAAELAILYTVFWYLYLRQPDQNRRIVGSTWGSYHPKRGNGFDLSGSCTASMEGSQCYLDSSGQSQTVSAVRPFMLAQDEMVLDLKTNRYVPVKRNGRMAIAELIRKVDDCLSEFNVKA